MPIALSSAIETAWWASLIGGLVVALAVWALLEALRRTVNEVDRAVSDLWVMGKRVAQNTATTHMLGGTKELGVELLEEVQRHGQLAEKRRSG
jgi:type II secretory pathway component PulF